MDGVTQQVAALARLTPKLLRQRYREVFGEDTKTGNAQWLRKRIAWRLQSLAEGDLSERARQRADELANDADLRLNPPKERVQTATTATPATLPLLVPHPDPVVQQPSDERLPPTGTILTRDYKGTAIKVTVLADGFEYDGERYASLSAAAKSITGNHMNGFLFFGMTRKSKGGKR
jgi:hypothetical protein